MAEQVTKIDLSKDLNASVARLEELRKGRNVSEIPINDEYWKALKNHRKHFNK